MHGTPKVRKVTVKAMKTYVEKILHIQYKKSLKFCRKETETHPVKKVTEIRRRELLESISPALLSYLQDHPQETVLGKSACVRVSCILGAAIGDTQPAMNAIASLAAAELCPGRKDGEPPPAGPLVLKWLIEQDKKTKENGRDGCFAKTLVEHVGMENLKSWLSSDQEIASNVKAGLKSLIPTLERKKKKSPAKEQDNRVGTSQKEHPKDEPHREHQSADCRAHSWQVQLQGCEPLSLLRQRQWSWVPVRWCTRPFRSLRLGGGLRKAWWRSRQAPSSHAFDGPRRDVSWLPQRPLLCCSTAMAQTLSSRRHWRRELSVLPAQSATPATPSPAPCASLWPNRGHSGVM
ncbi:hypothetical protein QTO34_019720, partial [Cnephaeus nilssonii]